MISYFSYVGSIKNPMRKLTLCQGLVEMTMFDWTRQCLDHFTRGQEVLILI